MKMFTSTKNDRKSELGISAIGGRLKKDIHIPKSSIIFTNKKTLF